MVTVCIQNCFCCLTQWSLFTIKSDDVLTEMVHYYITRSSLIYILCLYVLCFPVYNVEDKTDDSPC